MESEVIGINLGKDNSDRKERSCSEDKENVQTSKKRKRRRKRKKSSVSKKSRRRRRKQKKKSNSGISTEPNCTDIVLTYENQR